MAQHKYIPCDIYKRGIHVFVGTVEEFGKWIPQHFYAEIEKHFVSIVQWWIDNGKYGDASFHYNSECGEGVILIPQFPKNPKQIAALSHECLHATFFIMDENGVEYCRDTNNGAFTYLHEHLMRNALEDWGYEIVKTGGKKK